MPFLCGNKKAGVDKVVIDNLRDFKIKGGHVFYKRYEVHLSLAHTGFESEANRCFFELIKGKKKLQDIDNQVYVPKSAFHHGRNQQFTPRTTYPRVIERQTEMQFVRHMQDKLGECFQSRQRFDNVDDLTREIKWQFNTLKKAPSLKNENDQLRTDINSWKNAHAREINANKIKTMQLHDTIRSLQEEKAALNNRLAAEMNVRISANETTFENISIKERPLNIAQDYELLFSNAWLDAKMALDKHNALDSETQDEEWKVIMLLKMFQVSYTKASEVYEDTKTQAQHLLHYPGTPMKLEQHGLKKSVLTQESLTFLSDHFRKLSDTHNLDGLIENVSSQLTRGENALVDICLEVDNVKEYLAQCTRIAWKMVLQRPPMTLSTPGIGCSWKKYDGLELVWGSCPDNPGAKVRYYKKPQLYHGDRLMAKGHVFVK